MNSKSGVSENAAITPIIAINRPRDVVMDTIYQRRSVRRYEDKRVPRDTIETIMDAARWAPSAHNRQPWRFAVVESVAQKRELALAMKERLRRDLLADGASVKLIEQDTSRSYGRITSAPVLVLVCLSMIDMDTYPDERRSQNEYVMAVQSVAMAGQNLLLAAHRSGLAACWMCAPLFCPDVVREVLHLPNDWKPQGLVTVVYAAEVREKTRKPLETSVIWR
ncbi:MAG: nitroreductase family protein [Anaerolineae bacterium]